MNYFFSALSLWIANLGVEPFLSLAFFLFLPMFLSLKFLLHLVCSVFEAIIYYFVKKSLIKFQGEFVSICRFNVKVFFIISVLYPHCIYASASNHEDIYLARGEQGQIDSERIQSFSVGNKEVVSSKLHHKRGHILIKGKAIGFSDLVIWNDKGIKKSYNIYIVSKREQLKFSQIASDFKSLHLKTTLTNKKIIVEGEIKTNKELKIYNSFKLFYSKNIISFVTISKDLVRDNIASAYLALGPIVDKIECTYKLDVINCFTSPFEKQNSQLRYLESSRNIRFAPFENNFSTSNFEVQVAIYKVNFSEGSQESFGGYQASASLDKVISDPNNLINNNLFHLSGQMARSQLLAKPKFITSLNEKQSVQLGSELAFTSSNQTSSRTEWVFAGLKIQTSMKLVNGKIKVFQQTQVTNPIKEAIQGGKSESNIFITPGKEQLLFNISYESLINQEKAFPILGRIPILRKIFMNTEQYKSESKLIAYINVRKL